MIEENGIVSKRIKPIYQAARLPVAAIVDTTVKSEYARCAPASRVFRVSDVNRSRVTPQR